MLKDFIQVIKDKLESEPRLHAVLIYGSQANSSASPSSDIDIAYLADYKNPIDKFEFINMLAEIELLPELDIACLNTANTILAMQIMKNHVVVFLNNRKAYEQWKMSTLGMYHDLQITNRHIYKNLGKVS